jgi:hypothetical protein
MPLAGVKGVMHLMPGIWWKLGGQVHRSERVIKEER